MASYDHEAAVQPKLLLVLKVLNVVVPGEKAASNRFYPKAIFGAVNSAV
jgi:hypothetical protein